MNKENLSNATYVMQALQKWDRSQSGELQLFEERKPLKLQIMYVMWILEKIQSQSGELLLL